MNIHPQAVLRSGIKCWINVFLKVLFNWFPWILLSGIFPFTSSLSLCSLEKVTRIRRNLINLLIFFFFFLITWLSGHRLRCVFPFVIFTGMLTLAWKCCTIIFNHLPGVYVFLLIFNFIRLSNAVVSLLEFLPKVYSVCWKRPRL